MDFLLSISPSKEMGDCTRQRKNLPPGQEPNSRPLGGFDHLLLYQMSYEELCSLLGQNLGIFEFENVNVPKIL